MGNEVVVPVFYIIFIIRYSKLSWFPICINVNTSVSTCVNLVKTTFTSRGTMSFVVCQLFGPQDGWAYIQNCILLFCQFQVLSEERVTGTVTTALHHESNGELQGRISYENRGECFFLPSCTEDIEGNVTLSSGDTVSFQIATNQRWGVVWFGYWVN